jgi:hypothetical protein
MTDPHRAASAALAVLILVHAIMLLALFAGVPPHPPARVAPFGMAPFLGAVLSAAAAALILEPVGTPPGRALSVLTMALSLVSFGPHKLADPALPLIWPGLAAVWAALIALGLALFRTHQRAPR